MAKLRKILMYTLDEHESYKGSEDDIKEELRRIIGRSEMQPDLIDIETVRFPWCEGLAINGHSVNKEDYEKFIESMKEVKSQMRELVENEYDDFRDMVEKAMTMAGVEMPDNFSVVEFLVQMQKETENRMKTSYSV